MSTARSDVGGGRAIRLDSSEIDELLTTLDSQVPGGSEVRYRYRVGALRVQFRPKLGAELPAETGPSRCLSSTAICFLRTGYVYPGTAASVQLITLHGSWEQVEGEVVRCEYVHGSIHEVEVRFRQRIDPALYCADAVSHRVLVVEDDALLARMIGSWLRDMNAQVEFVHDGGAAVEAAMKGGFDLVLLDVELPGQTGPEITAALRKQGYFGTIIGMTALSRRGLREECLGCGFDEFLAKPFSRAVLSRVIRTLAKEPIFSTLQDADLRELVGEFIGTLPKTSQQIQAALADGDQAALSACVRALKAQGAANGFELLSTLATEIYDRLANGCELTAVSDQVRRLRFACSQVRSTSVAS